MTGQCFNTPAGNTKDTLHWHTVTITFREMDSGSGILVFLGQKWISTTFLNTDWTRWLYDANQGGRGIPTPSRDRELLNKTL